MGGVVFSAETNVHIQMHFKVFIANINLPIMLRLASFPGPLNEAIMLISGHTSTVYYL